MDLKIHKWSELVSGWVRRRYVAVVMSTTKVAEAI